MDRKAFFDALRKRDSGVFGTSLTVGQVGGAEAIIDEAMKRKTPQPHLAYMLATAYHETAHTMQPVRETLAVSDDQAIARLDTAFRRGKLPWVKTPYWRKDKDGKSWLGRGLPQLTHKSNYEKMSKIVGVDLVEDPNRAMIPDVAIKIMFEGMERGSFTGHKLSDYDSPKGYDNFNARRIINGVESAKTVAGYAQVFDKALTAAGYDPHAVPVPAPKPVDAPKPATVAIPAPKPEPQPAKPVGGKAGGFWSALAGIFLKILGGKK